MKLNKKIAETLDMELPEEYEDSAPSTQPHELVKVDNPELPPMEDIEKRMLEGETQLDEVIDHSLKQYKEYAEGISEIEPKYRNRYMETSNQTLQIALDAIKHKTQFQLNKKKSRLEDAKFSVDSDNKSGGIPNQGGTTVYFGDREALFKELGVTKDEE